MIKLTFEEGFIPDDTVAIDATHIEARDRAPKKQEQQKEPTAPKKRGREPEMEGFDEHFTPTCVREHSYRYDSYDPKYETLKYVRPKECERCPLAHDYLCQKVYKVKVTFN